MLLYLIRHGETDWNMQRKLQGCQDIPFVIEPRIKEIDWGDWDGRSIAELRSSSEAEVFEMHKKDPMNFPGAPGGETDHQLWKRTKEFYQDLIANEDYQDKTILISTHGCASRAILNNVYEDHTDFWHGNIPGNCAVNIVKIENGNATILEEDKIYY